MAGKSLNKVQIIGHLGADPELRYTSNGLAVATFRAATNERFKSSDSDEWQERTEWHQIVAWGRLAEIVGEYLAKGRQVYVEGRLQTRTWDDKDGIKRYTTEVVARDIILLGGRGDFQSQRPPHPADTYSTQAPTHTGAVSDNHAELPNAELPNAELPNAELPNAELPNEPDDIPF